MQITIIDKIKFLWYSLQDKRYIKERFCNKYTKKKVRKKASLGEGGNAMVFRVISNVDQSEYALKQLKVRNKEKVGRFQEEISVMADNWQTISGIMPIEDYNLAQLWYTMPVATEIIKYIKDKKPSPTQIVEMFIPLVETFIELHKRGIAHRDIKPANIYWLNDRMYIGDFGLVDFPDNPNDFTSSEMGLGAVFTIAPEMKRDPKHADGLKADVFSLAKTLWMLLTLDEKGFDGPYDFSNKTHALRLLKQYRNVHLVELEELLTDATNDDPAKRPDILLFRARLGMWLSVCSNFHLSQISDWEFVKKLIFRKSSGRSISWDQREDIVEILNLFTYIPASNHLMFAEHGGLDLLSAEIAPEDGCIYLTFEPYVTFLVRPKLLHYENFNDATPFNYLLMEVEPLPVIVGDMVTPNVEECVIEDYPAHYVSAQYAQYHVYDYETGRQLPQGARLIHRYFGGSLLLVLKDGLYNQRNETYDGRHSTVTPQEFRKYIEGIISVCFKPDSTRAEIDKAFNAISKPQRLPQLAPDTTHYAPSDFVENNLKKWNFLQCLPTYTQIPSHTIAFVLEVSGLQPFIDHLTTCHYYLLADGTIGQETDTVKAALLYDRDTVMAVINRIQAEIVNYAKAEGYEDINVGDNIFLVPVIESTCKPTHLFTMEELETLMRTADDRETNKLVIDELGYFKIVHDVNEGFLYPVSHEAWCAGNNYVGKYSTLSELESFYMDSLVCWLEYLKTGRRIVCDYNRHCDIDAVVKTIKELMF